MPPEKLVKVKNMNPVKSSSTAHQGNCPCIPCYQNGIDDAPLGLQPPKGQEKQISDDSGHLKLTRNELWERSNPY